jgi:hypothetical protein
MSRALLILCRLAALPSRAPQGCGSGHEALGALFA